MKEKEPRIIKDDKSHPVYLNKWDTEVEAYRESLYDYCAEMLRQMETLTELLDDEAFASYGFVCEALLRDSGRRLEAVCDLIEKRIGKINIDTPMRKQPGYDDLPIGVVFKPTNGEVQA